MADSVSFILRNAPVKQLIKGILPVCLSCVLGEISICRDVVAKEYLTWPVLSYQFQNVIINCFYVLTLYITPLWPFLMTYYLIAFNALGLNNFFISKSKEMKCMENGIICIYDLFRCHFKYICYGCILVCFFWDWFTIMYYRLSS